MKRFALSILMVTAVYVFAACGEDDPEIVVSGMYAKTYNMHDDGVPSSGANAKFFIHFELNTLDGLQKITIPTIDLAGWKWDLYDLSQNVYNNNSTKFSRFLYDNNHPDSVALGLYTVVLSTGAGERRETFWLRSLTGSVSGYAAPPRMDVAGNPSTWLLELPHTANAVLSGTNLSVDVGFYTGYTRSFYLWAYDSASNYLGIIPGTNVSAAMALTTNRYTFPCTNANMVANLSFIYVQAGNATNVVDAWAASRGANTAVTR